MTDALLWVLFAALLLALWRFALWRPRALPGVTRSAPLLVGHRGVRGPRPENTVAAFELALGSGLDGIETDVQMTADGHLVLFHDFAPKGQPVWSFRLADLRAEVPNLATLDELFALALRYPGRLLNVELKAEGLRTGGLERAAARTIRASGVMDRVLVSSFNPLTLLKLRVNAPEIRTGLLYAPDLPLWLRTGWLAGWLHADALHPHESLVTPELLAWARARNLAVNTWTVNDPLRITSLHAQKLSAIMGDDPAVLLRAAHRSP